MESKGLGYVTLAVGIGAFVCAALALNKITKLYNGLAENKVSPPTSV